MSGRADEWSKFGGKMALDGREGLETWPGKKSPEWANGTSKCGRITNVNMGFAADGSRLAMFYLWQGQEDGCLPEDEPFNQFALDMQIRSLLPSLNVNSKASP